MNSNQNFQNINLKIELKNYRILEKCEKIAKSTCKNSKKSQNIPGWAPAKSDFRPKNVKYTRFGAGFTMLKPAPAPAEPAQNQVKNTRLGAGWIPAGAGAGPFAKPGKHHFAGDYKR